MKFIYDYCLNSMNSRKKLEFISSADYMYSGIFLISFKILNVIQFSRNTTSFGNDLMLVMVFSAQVDENFLGLEF